jgi:CheY-like chemotaxis protein/two-component sensor histidine kinase
MPSGAVEIRPTIGDIEDAKLIHSIEVAKRFGRKTAHDFNNILAVIQGFAYILQNRLQGDEANRGITQQIEASALEAFKLTNWLSTFANNKPTELAPMDLNKVVEECLTAFCSEKPSSVDLHIELATEPLFLMGDEVQLEQVCRELWSNAIEAMPHGGQVRFQTGMEEFPQRSVPGQEGEGLSLFCRLRISDTGVGVDPETQKRMFEPFFSTKSGKDRGLGLSTVYDVVHAHQGFVQVSSQPGVGTCIDLYFPAQERHNPEERPEQRSGKVLVDDEEMIRVMIQHMLKGRSCEVVGAASGGAALDAYQKANGEIKAVILDMTLPGMSGAEAFKKLKMLNSQVKVIVSTGDPHQQAVHDIMAQGAFGILAKPFSTEHLIQVVQQALD